LYEQTPIHPEKFVSERMEVYFLSTARGIEVNVKKMIPFSLSICLVLRGEFDLRVLQELQEQLELLVRYDRWGQKEILEKKVIREIRVILVLKDLKVSKVK
jgi:hypothetical protein